MFKVIEKETGRNLNVYSVDGDHFVVGTDGGFEFKPMSLFAPVEENNDDAPAQGSTQSRPCTVFIPERHDTDLDAALDVLVSGIIPVELGTTISTQLLDGTEIDLVVTDFSNGSIRLESRDCLGINTSANDLKDYLNRVYALLPDALKSRIVEVERLHLDGNNEKVVERCKLFVPTASEVFPPDECYGDEGLYKQMEWYKDVHNRVRADHKGGDAHWYWLNSPFSSGSYCFCHVNSGGSADYGSASTTGGLAPFGCIISKI